MSADRILEMQCTHARFLEMLPKAIEHRPFELVDDRVTVHDGDRCVTLIVHDEPVRRLGSLDLPMESVVFQFPDHSDAEADAFMSSFREHTLRAGGG